MEKHTSLPSGITQVDVIFKKRNDDGSAGEYTYKSYAEERGANRRIIPFMHTLIERDWCDPFRQLAMAAPPTPRYRNLVEAPSNVLPSNWRRQSNINGNVAAGEMRGGRRRYKKTRKVKKSRKNKAKKSRRH